MEEDNLQTSNPVELYNVDTVEPEKKEDENLFQGQCLLKMKSGV